MSLKWSSWRKYKAKTVWLVTKIFQGLPMLTAVSFTGFKTPHGNCTTTKWVLRFLHCLPVYLFLYLSFWQIADLESKCRMNTGCQDIFSTTAHTEETNHCDFTHTHKKYMPVLCRDQPVLQCSYVLRFIKSKPMKALKCGMCMGKLCFFSVFVRHTHKHSCICAHTTHCIHTCFRNIHLKVSFAQYIKS